MKKTLPLASIASFLLLIGMGIFFSYMSTGTMYSEYRKLWEYRRLHPQIMPSIDMLRMTSVGHDTTYADILWIRLIQFIGDNIGNGGYINFTHTILSQIQGLHPRFARAYELDILLLPSPRSDEPDDITVRKTEILQESLAQYDAIMERVCDTSKIEQIISLGFGDELWSRRDLHNPCISGLIPYYLASRYDSDVKDPKKASVYYKIASMHDDAPAAAKFLGIIALANTGKHKDSALTLALLANSGYDESPFECQEFALKLVNDLTEHVAWTPEWIDTLEKTQKILKKPINTSPLSIGNGTCYELLERSAKQIYIGYITEITQEYDDVRDEADILETKLLQHIPTIASQSGFTITKKDGIWKYRHK